MYTIQPYTKKQAKKIGVMVKPSTDPKKKIDVFKGDQKVASVGATGYKDYPTFWKEDGKAVAEERRRLYHIRHKKDSEKKGSPGYYASLLLW
jgi:hypothetical protein